MALVTYIANSGSKVFEVYLVVPTYYFFKIDVMW